MLPCSMNHSQASNVCSLFFFVVSFPFASSSSFLSMPASSPTRYARFAVPGPSHVHHENILSDLFIRHVPGDGQLESTGQPYARDIYRERPCAGSQSLFGACRAGRALLNGSQNFVVARRKPVSASIPTGSTSLDNLWIYLW